MGIFIQSKTSKAFFGRLLDKLVKSIEFYGVNRIPDREMLLLLCDRIQNSCGRRNAESIFIVTDTDKGYSKRVVDKILCQLSEAGISAKSREPGRVIGGAGEYPGIGGCSYRNHEQGKPSRYAYGQ